MTRVTLITSGKGGVGKSSITTLLGFFLTLLGKKVAIIDLDAGISSIAFLLKETDPIYNLYDLLQGNCELNSALLCSKYRRLDFIAAPNQPTDEFLTQEKFLNLIENLQGYHFLLLDSPAGLRLSESITGSTVDDALIVANPEPLCLEGAKNISYILNERGIKEKRLIINKFSKKAWPKSELQNLDELIDFVFAQLIAIIPFDSKFEQFQKNFINIKASRLLYKTCLNLAKRYVGDEVELAIK